jgi:epimerase transport system membrane fusion protein
MAIDPARIGRTGLATIVVVFGGLGVWGATAPLHGAVVVDGLVKVATFRKTVQHNEGGIVKAILVRDGDVVTRGQTLIQLQDAPVVAQHRIVRGALDGELARQARLTAEATLADQIAFAPELRNREDDPQVAELQRRERALFESRRGALDEQRKLIRAQVEETREEIAAVLEQRETDLAALEFARQELARYEALQEQAYVAEVLILAQRRMVAQYESRTSERRAERSRAEQRITSLELRFSAIRDEYTSRAAEELKENSVRILELRERLVLSEDGLRRQAIVAPVGGTVIGLRVHTEGATIGPREPLLDIVPGGEAVLIEARAPLDSIKQLYVGQHADIRFTALPSRTTPMIDGAVRYVSPDAMADPEGRMFFQVHLEPDAQSLGAAKIANLEPGMAAQAYIQTESRTALDYLFRPISDSLLRAFRER